MSWEGLFSSGIRIKRKRMNGNGKYCDCKEEPTNNLVLRKLTLLINTVLWHPACLNKRSINRGSVSGVVIRTVDVFQYHICEAWDRALRCKRNSSSLRYKWQAKKYVIKNRSATCAIYVLCCRKRQKLQTNLKEALFSYKH